MLRRLLLSVFIVAVAALSVKGQTVVRGVVEDSASHERLVSASVSYLRKGKAIQFSRTDAHGEFSITVPAVEMGDQIQATMMGYGKRRKGVPLKAGRSVTIALPSETFMLKEVKVQGGRVRGRDTITYDLTRFATERDNSLKDVLRKLPGVDVARNGTISYNGKEISRFTVEGLDMTGGRYNQLTENVRANDVKSAEIMEHDQPVKALRDKVYTDNVGINVTLKDEARDRLTATLRPYLLVGDPTHVGGSANARQIGKRRQLMYNAAYDRKGLDLSLSSAVFGLRFGMPDAVSVPSWYTVPSLSAPIDEERMRFNTSQRYGVNRISKTKNDNELRTTVEYNRSVVRQTTENRSLYVFDGDTPTETAEQLRKTIMTDQFEAEVEHKVNTDEHYGNELLRVTARQDDGESLIGGGLHQRVRTPQVNMEGSVFRMFSLRKGRQITWRSLVDYHHAVADLYIDEDRNRLRTNLWHTAHEIGWMRKKGAWTQNIDGRVEAENVNVAQKDNLVLSADIIPRLLYKSGDIVLSLAPQLGFERYTRQRQSLFNPSPTLSATWTPTTRSEWLLFSAYSQEAGDMANYAIDQYRRDYRTWYVAGDVLPVSKSLMGSLRYQYKRPIHELFMNVNVTVSRLWNNATSDMRIIDGNYYYTLKEQHSRSDSYAAGSSVSKGFHDLHLKLSMGVNGALSKGSQLSADRWYNYTTRQLTLLPGIIFSPKWGEIDYGGRFVFSGSETSGQSQASLFSWRQQLTLTSTIGHVDLSFKMVHHRNELQENNTLNTLLCDCSATWRLRKARFSVQLCNLFDKRAYEQTVYSGIATSTTTYILRPRELVVSAELSL